MMTGKAEVYLAAETEKAKGMRRELGKGGNGTVQIMILYFKNNPVKKKI